MQDFALELLGGAPAVAGRDDERIEARPGLRWSAAESGGGVTLGDEAVLRPGDVAASGEAALLKRGGFWLKAMAWRAELVPERVEALRARERRRTPERAPSAHCMDTPQPGEVGGGERCGPSRASEDARMLWIDWDSQGERYKPWRTVCQESRQLDHADLGLGGEGTALHMAKMMEGQGRDHRLWAERWLREKGIERDSRTGH